MNRTMNDAQPESVGPSGAIISDLRCIIAQVREMLKLIEAEIAGGKAFQEGGAHDIVVLDDVTPRYVQAGAVLRECDIRLSTAAHLLQGSMASDDC